MTNPELILMGLTATNLAFTIAAVTTRSHQQWKYLNTSWEIIDSLKEVIQTMSQVDQDASKLIDAQSALITSQKATIASLQPNPQDASDAQALQASVNNAKAANPEVGS